MPLTGSPARSIAPADGRSRPPRRCNSVDLPHPLGPMMATVSPVATSRSTPSTARTTAAPEPNVLQRPEARSTGRVDVITADVITAPFDRSNSARRPPASAGPPGVATRLPPAARLHRSGPAPPWWPAERLAAAAAALVAGHRR